MTALLFKLAGGIGLVLLGMVLLTDGVKAFAGESLQRALVRFTGTPLKAFGATSLAAFHTAFIAVGGKPSSEPSATETRPATERQLDQLAARPR